MICNRKLDRRFCKRRILPGNDRLMETLPAKQCLEVYGWCIMPGHLHMIIGSKKNKPEDIVRDMKNIPRSLLKN